MTARERIIEFLTGRTGHVSTTIVHDHIESLGYKRCSSCSALSKMATRGEVLIEGYHIHTFAKLNPAYKATEASARQTANHSHLAKTMGRVPGKPKRENAIFDMCREYSSIYRLIDRPLRGVRV